MTENGIKPIDELQKLIYPWETEELLLFSLMFEEWGHKDLLTDPNTIHKIFNEIREFNHPELMGKEGIDFLDSFILSTGQIQFSHQNAFIFNVWRYYYFFTFKNEDIDMNEEFKSKFECDYHEVLTFALSVHALYCSEIIDEKLIKTLIERFPNAFELLSIDVECLRERQKEYTHDYLDYKYGFKYFYQYPIIKSNNSHYFPVPHLTVTASTSSLLYRLTEGNDQLRSKFGKEVFEAYVFDLISSFGIYDLVKPEQEYKVGKNLKKSPDVLVKDGEYCILMDCKSSVLPTKTRLFNEEVISKFQARVAEAITQVYKNIKNDFNKNYFPFGREVQFEQENVFGLVVVPEDILCERRRLYEKVAQNLKLSPDSKEYQFLCSNIKVASALDLEQLFIKQNNLTNGLRILRDCEEKRFDMRIPETEKVKLKPIETQFTRVFMKITHLKEEIFQVCSIRK